MAFTRICCSLKIALETAINFAVPSVITSALIVHISVCVCACAFIFYTFVSCSFFLCPCQVLFDCLICRWAAVSTAKWETAAKNIVAYFSVPHWKWCAINTRAKPAMSTATVPLLAMKTSTKIKKFLCLFASLFGQWRGRMPGAGKGGHGM